MLGLAVGYGVLRLRQPWRDIGMSFAHATLLLDLLLYPGMSLLDGVGDFRWIYSWQTPTLSVVAGIVHAAGLVAYIVLARLQSRQSRREARNALTEQFSGQQVTLRDEIVARLAILETAERVRRLEPEEREELNHLRELREWSIEHNQKMTEAPAHPPATPEQRPEASPLPETGPLPEGGPMPPSGRGPHPGPHPGSWRGPLPGSSPFDDDRRN